MTSVFYALIILPIIIVVLVSFVFQSVMTSLISVKNEVMCPWPAASGLWNNSGTITYTNQTYNYRAVNNNVLTLTCTPVHTPNGVDYNYGQPAVAIGIFYFFGDVLSELGHKIVAFFTLVGLFFTYPLAITGMAWWAYAQFVLFSFIILGIIMVARGN